ncbi:hypothetical protein [Prescottella sp. R16]|uniref:hypothetical protein n=1 Tax=Prescottella sp. R16 TaxID=3064529 RepID=UPI00272DE27D|nr:hypothetical protein [Prescottella sp. R16]
METTPEGPVPGSRPPGPEHLGPVLEWSLPTRKLRWQAGLLLIAVTVVFLTVANGFSWMTYWDVWLFVLAGGLFMYWRLGGEWFAAGARWVQVNSSWVDTYELVEIKFSADGVNRVLRLKDSSGRQIYSFRLRNVQSNPRMWDLVYNGILHSVASGECRVTPRARQILKLPVGSGE